MKSTSSHWLAPRYWPTWIGFGLFWLVTRLPYPAVMRCGRALGSLMHHGLPGRRRVTRTNLRLAFPEASAQQIASLTRESFSHVGMGIAETAWCWYRDAEKIPNTQITGGEHVDAALARGKGVILLQAHFTLLELCAPVVGSQWPINAVYDSPKNPLFADRLLQHRSRFLKTMIDNKGIREMVRLLKRGEIVWYSPDQSVRAVHGGIPTRYFGQPVLTTAGTARIVKMTGAAVVPFLPERLPDGSGYAFRFQPPLALDVSDTVQATQQVNDYLEAQVRTRPAQYLWLHKRFKPPSPEIGSPYRR